MGLPRPQGGVFYCLRLAVTKITATVESDQ